ncbi:DOF zinc finger protein DOF5.7-like protein [Tanacetum coccineum]|uniref:DOF zinc finger protein DOF5.7-like protein n=1 Tax=Tanacetum coccineum TaxID=301880 RepID=A0ABQ5FK16_9ASTR
MSLDNTTPPTQHTKYESQTSAGCSTSGVEKEKTYWTKGGALRNVPISGGCKKKKTRSSSSRDLSSLEIGGLNLFTGLSPPAMDFQLNASSIDSLSSINQDLCWKLQQQRLASLFSGICGLRGESEQQNQIDLDSQVQKLQPIMIQNLETSKPLQTSMISDLRRGGCSLEIKWFFDENYAHVNVDQTQMNRVVQSHNGTIRNYENGNMNDWNNEYLYDTVAIMESLSLSSLASSLLKKLIELLGLPLLPAFYEASEIPGSKWLIV